MPKALVGTGRIGPGRNSELGRCALRSWGWALTALEGQTPRALEADGCADSELWTDGRGATSCIFSGLVAEVHQLQPHQQFVPVPSFLLCSHSLHLLLASPFLVFRFFF